MVLRVVKYGIPYFRILKPQTTPLPSLQLVPCFLIHGENKIIRECHWPSSHGSVCAQTHNSSSPWL